MPPSCTPPDGWLQNRCWQHQLCSLRASCSAYVATWSGEPGIVLSECSIVKESKGQIQKIPNSLKLRKTLRHSGQRFRLKEFFFQVTDPFTRPTRGTAERGSTSSPAQTQGQCCFNALVPVNSFILVRCFKRTSSWSCWNLWNSL